MMTTAPPASVTRHKAEGLVQRVWSSLHDSIGEIVFGMEDGTVSIFGLVFGVAASAPDATTVLLAGATGAAAAAVSMMAGTFLDADAGAIVSAIERTPGASVNFASAFVLQIGDAATGNPLVKSLWMFFADLFAAFVPV